MNTRLGDFVAKWIENDLAECSKAGMSTNFCKPDTDKGNNALVHGQQWFEC